MFMVFFQHSAISDLKGELIPHLVRKQFKKPKRPEKDVGKPDQSVIVEVPKAGMQTYTGSVDCVVNYQYILMNQRYGVILF